MVALGLEAARRRPGPILFLAALNLLFALVATAPLSAQLSRLIDDRPAASAIADGADDAPRAELLQDHPELASTALACALLALAIWSVLSWIASGGFLDDSDTFGASSARHAWRMIKVGALGVVVRLPVLLGPLTAWAFHPLAHDFPSLALVTALGVLISGAIWSLGTVTIDRALGYAIHMSAWRSLRAAVRASRKQFGGTMAIAAFSGVGFVSLTLLQISTTHALPPTGWGGTFALVAGVLGALGRAGFSAVTLLAAKPSTRG